jgi:hypothetical protein
LLEPIPPASPFVSGVCEALTTQGVSVARINDLATRARALGFPILSEHTFQSTLWIMAECMRQEAEAALRAQVILVDRPVPDALGYLLAALEASGRTIEEQRLAGLRQIAAAHVKDYDHLVLTAPDPSIALGEDRDTDAGFRAAADRHVTAVMNEVAPRAAVMTADNAPRIIGDAIALALNRVSATS